MPEIVEAELTTASEQPEETQPEKTLEELAAVINEAHLNARKAIHAGALYAKDCGDALIEAKRRLRHGEWGMWLAANCQVKHRTANLYMRLAQKWSVIEESKWKRVADLSLRGALAVLAEYRPGEEEEPDDLPRAPETRRARDKADQLQLAPGGAATEVIAEDVSETDDNAAANSDAGGRVAYEETTKVILAMTYTESAEFFRMADEFGPILNTTKRGETVLAVFRRVHAHLDWFRTL